MSGTLLEPQEVTSPSFPPQVWETLPPSERQALLALLATCLLRMITLMSHPLQQEVPDEPPVQR